MREIKLRLQVLQAAKRLSRAARMEPCHLSEGVIIMWGGGYCRKGEPQRK